MRARKPKRRNGKNIERIAAAVIVLADLSLLIDYVIH